MSNRGMVILIMLALIAVGGFLWYSFKAMDAVTRVVTLS